MRPNVLVRRLGMALVVGVTLAPALSPGARSGVGAAYAQPAEPPSPWSVPVPRVPAEAKGPKPPPLPATSADRKPPSSCVAAAYGRLHARLEALARTPSAEAANLADRYGVEKESIVGEAALREAGCRDD